MRTKFQWAWIVFTCFNFVLLSNIKGVELDRSYNGRLFIQNSSNSPLNPEVYQFGVANIPLTQDKMFHKIQSEKTALSDGSFTSNTKKAILPIYSSLARLSSATLKPRTPISCKQKIQTNSCRAEEAPSITVTLGDNDFEKNQCDLLKEFCKDEWDQLIESESGIVSILEEVKVQTLRLDTFFKNLESNVSITQAIRLSVPDDQAQSIMPFSFIRQIRKGNHPILNTPLLCPDSPECDRKKIREFVAFSFESFVRLAIAGSDQLKVDRADYGTNQARSEKIYGIYDGLRPDLFRGIEKSGFLNPFYYSADRDLGSCASGIVFQGNSDKKWFKNPDSTFEQDVINGAVKNFKCQNTPLSTFESVPKGRGIWIGLIIEIAEWMASQIRNGGGVLDQVEFFNSTTTSPCGLMRAEIQAFRAWNRMQFEKLSESRFSPCDGVNASSAVCYWDANLRLTELDYVTEYAFCVWESYANEIYKRLLMF